MQKISAKRRRPGLDAEACACDSRAGTPWYCRGGRQGPRHVDADAHAGARDRCAAKYSLSEAPRDAASAIGRHRLIAHEACTLELVAALTFS